MANLSKEQALELIKAPKYQREINRAKQKRLRHRLHTEAETELVVLTDPQVRWLQWVESILRSEDNYARFRNLFRPPVGTNELIESIFSEFEKVFEAQNSYEKFEFTDPELEQDFTDYRKRIGDFSFWETQGFETFKNDIDNILVVDLPKLTVDASGALQGMSKDGKPEPYYYVLDIDNLVDIHNTKVKATDTLTGKQFYFFKTEYLIFNGEGDLIYVFDDTYWRTFKKDNDVITFVSESEHELGYCPARSFWTTPLNSKTMLLKRGPITNNLSDLDWLLFLIIAERYLQLYAPFPIYAVYKTKCTYKEEGGLKRKCIGGFLEQEGSRVLPSERERCPKCKDSLKTGPGNVILLDMPKDGDEFDAMVNPIKIIPAEITSLDYMRKTVKDLKQEIFVSCVGRSQDPQNAQAKNEMQVESGVESSQSVLLKIKRNFEIIHSFALDTVARIRYGEAYVSGTVNYGDKFFFADEDKEVEQYKTAVDTGLPEWDLANRREDINNARYRNNPKLKERNKILENLLPFPDYSIVKLQEFRKDMPEVVTLSDFVVKMKFNEFVQRFEREQANLLLFASAQPFDIKVKLIREEFEKYAAEYLAAAEKDKPEPPKPPVPVPPVPGPQPGPQPPEPPKPPVPQPQPQPEA